MDSKYRVLARDFDIRKSINFAIISFFAPLFYTMGIEQSIGNLLSVFWRTLLLIICISTFLIFCLIVPPIFSRMSIVPIGIFFAVPMPNGLTFEVTWLVVGSIVAFLFSNLLLRFFHLVVVITTWVIMAIVAALLAVGILYYR